VSAAWRNIFAEDCGAEARRRGVFQMDVGEIDNVVAVADGVSCCVVVPAGQAVPFGGFDEIKC
jgi:hypothetical protein